MLKFQNYFTYLLVGSIFDVKLRTMSKREELVHVADGLIKSRGYNAFSYHDLSETVGIKTASIHYHFKTKSDLGVAVIHEELEILKDLINRYATKSPIENLERFMTIYSKILKEGNVCLVGSLTTDLNTVEPNMQQALKEFSTKVLEWVGGFLDKGRQVGDFHFKGTPRARALMLITNMLGMVQLARLTDPSDFELVKTTLKNDLLVP